MAKAILYCFKNMVIYCVVYQILDHDNLQIIRLQDFSQPCSKSFYYDPSQDKTTINVKGAMSLKRKHCKVAGDLLTNW